MTRSVAPQRAGNLPAENTSFVGRDAEVAEIVRMLRLSRLVTLTGGPGVGKTRLALRAAAALQADFQDGVALAELSALQATDIDLLPLTIAAALVEQDQTSRPMLDVLVDRLAHRRLLLILDTCERLVEACAEVAAALLRAAPSLRILVTSRQALRIAGEHTLVVLPLSVPNPGRTNRTEAMDLFADRAAEVTPGFGITDDNAPQAARLCRILEGIPLALELAAVRLRTLSLPEIVERLDDRFELLSYENPAVPRRHQTLRGAVGWSHELCEPEERLLWSRLSVFPGEFDLDAVEHICADDRLPVGQLVDLMYRLVDKSIVIVERGSGGVRYRLLDTVREYGREWLREIGEERTLRRRHRDYYLRLAEQGEEAWFSPYQAETFARTQAEHANLRSALDFSLGTPGESTVGLRLAGTLWFYWVGCGHLTEGRHWLDRALAVDGEVSGNPEPTDVTQRTAQPELTDERGKALWVAGYVAILQGDNPGAVRLLTECRDAAQRSGNARALAYSLHRLGCAALMADDHVTAAIHFEDALMRYEALGELNSNVLMARIELAMAVAFQGDLDRASELCTQASAVCEEHGEQWALAYAHYVLSFTAWVAGDTDEAITLARSSLRINHAFHDMVGTVIPVELLALYIAMGGAHEDAAVLQGAAQQIWRFTGLPLFGSRYFNAPHEQCEALVRHALGDRAYEAAFRRGAELTIDATVAYALGERS